ncbi:hypothetical protein AGENTSMITH_172 [Bacillus phage vB_BspM_AgentSmith]|nr:hypothetical protein AGENTSMITH_172 [Bacillus phage vB_BspM_AgentSmith]
MHIENKEITYKFTIRGNKFKIVIWKGFIRVYKERSEITTLIPSQLKNILNALEYKVFGVSNYTEFGYEILSPPERFNLATKE